MIEKIEPEKIGISPDDLIEAARNAITEYNTSFSNGGEVAYPHWADEVLKECDK